MKYLDNYSLFVGVERNTPTTTTMMLAVQDAQWELEQERFARRKARVAKFKSFFKKS